MSPLTPEDTKLSSSVVEGQEYENESSITSTNRSTSPIKPMKQRNIQLFNDVEDKTQEALGTFTEIGDCIYHTKNIGAPMKKNTINKHKPEFMTCDCQEEWDGELRKNLACGEDSNCINRITSVECINKHCSCGEDCENQRFQKKLYSKVSVFQTELKGYGLKSEEIINENQFIYEYIGEVINETDFRKRMIEYDLENYKHFYFMMLDHDSFIDATKKGCLARFANHSCNPNAYVDKWVVGDKLRMGIFAKRRIEKGEEITFDYNVDRYGAQSQPCYCGEPNCIKFMGGKTQTDAALLLPEVLADALGVTPKQEKQWLKENKSIRKDQQSDESKINEKFVQSIEALPLTEFDVSKIMSALMKCQEILIIDKLVERIYKTNDSDINGLLVRFHGYKTMSNLLQEILSKNNDDILQQDKDELICKIFEILLKWPALSKNKISSAQIEEVVQDIQSGSNNEKIKQLADELLKKWSVLEMAYRIPKLEINTVDISGIARTSNSPEPLTATTATSTTTTVIPNATSPQQGMRPRPGDMNYGLPMNWTSAYDAGSGKYYYYHKVTQQSLWDRPPGSLPLGPKPPIGPGINGKINKYNETDLARREELRLQQEKQQKLREIEERQRHIREIIEQNKSQNSTPVPESNDKQRTNKPHHSAHNHQREHKHKEHKHKHGNGNGNEQLDVKKVEKQWKYLLAKHIPNYLKKYESEIGKDNIKGCAKELVATVTRGEMKLNPTSPAPVELDSKRLQKIKQLTHDYMEKFMNKYRSKKRKHDEEEQVDNGDKRVKN